MALIQTSRLNIINSVKRVNLAKPRNWNMVNTAGLQNTNRISNSSYSVCTNTYKNGSKSLLQLPVSNNFHRSLATAPTLEFVTMEAKGDGNKVGVITINRPKALNALNDRVVQDICDALKQYDNDPNIGAIVLTGSEKAFAAGADIKAMSGDKKFADVYVNQILSHWDQISSTRTPIIAAVNGFALGGGCELAMMCDIIIAGEKAKFGQPEINIGTIPGAGGTQRLTHAVGKSRSMQICLTGEMITAQQANDWGLVSSVHPPEQLVDVAVDIGNKIAKQSKVIIQMAKESVNNAYEMPLQAGLKSEKRIFYTTFATEDRKEGMQAFIEKRKPNFTDQ